jgi:hypothetical protein
MAIRSIDQNQKQVPWQSDRSIDRSIAYEWMRKEGKRFLRHTKSTDSLRAKAYLRRIIRSRGTPYTVSIPLLSVYGCMRACLCAWGRCTYPILVYLLSVYGCMYSRTYPFCIYTIRIRMHVLMYILFSDHLCVCMYACMHVFMYVCMHVCMRWIRRNLYPYAYHPSLYGWMHARMYYVCMHVGVHTYVCLHACMCACM